MNTTDDKQPRSSAHRPVGRSAASSPLESHQFSMTAEVFALLKQFADQEHRSLSQQLATLVYEGQERRARERNR
jgi:hypothetical protein